MKKKAIFFFCLRSRILLFLTQIPFFRLKVFWAINAIARYENESAVVTVWKFHNFSITQILREIKFWNLRSAKSDISRHLEALNFDFYEFLHFLKAEKHQIQLIQNP